MDCRTVQVGEAGNPDLCWCDPVWVVCKLNTIAKGLNFNRSSTDWKTGVGLNYKCCEVHRVAVRLWGRGRKDMWTTGSLTYIVIILMAVTDWDTERVDSRGDCRESSANSPI